MKIQKFHNKIYDLRGIEFIIKEKRYRIGFNFKSLKLIKRYTPVLNSKLIWYFKGERFYLDKLYKDFELRILFLQFASRKQI